MQVILHCGAHSTEEDRLLKTLLRNVDRFGDEGVAVPGPSQYRNLLKDGMARLLEQPGTPISAAALWDQILDGRAAERVILSNPHFFGSQRRALDGHMLYPEAEARVRALQALFPADQLELHIAIRDPGGFVPGLLENAGPDRINTIATEISPQCLRWSDLFERLRQTAPEVAITTWCYEDMPILWGRILRSMAGLEDGARISGGMDLLASIMSGEGMRRLRQYLAQYDELSEAHRQRIFVAFLDKYALEDELVEEVDMPGWTEEMLEQATEMYDQDVARISQMDGVTLLSL